jgi:sugar-specific transcriptional regulator TrmB
MLIIEKFLQDFGLSQKEAKVFLTMQEIGTNAVSVIAKKADLTRTTVYAVLESLHRKGLASFYEKSKVRFYTAERPETIQYMLEEKNKKITDQRERFQDLLPHFLNVSKRGEVMPRVRYFEGIEGIKEIYDDTLKDGVDKLAYSSVPDIQNDDLKNYIQSYVQKRADKGMKVRAIFPDTPKSQGFCKHDTKLLRESRLVPADKFPFRSEINIYGKKMAIMSLQSTFLHGVIIESEAIVETERSIFELAWLGAREFQN